MVEVLGAAGVILVLIGLGYFARRQGLLRPGDERVLNAVVYYFALPALLLLELAQAAYTGDTLRFLAAGGLPLLLLVLGLALLRLAGLPREAFYRLSVSSVFGSLAFFGIPFVEYGVGGAEAVRLAALAVGLLGPFGVGFVLTLLELHGNRGQPLPRALARTLGRLARNPLIGAILMGLTLGLIGVRLPRFFAQVLRYLGSATAPLALLALGAFLYGRPRRALGSALGLSLLRLAALPALTLLFARLLGLPPLETTVLVLMNGTPLAVNMLVLSQRYGFYVEEMASLTLVSSLGALVSLSLWRFVLGARL
ncbi:MAG: AEC family transporter [Candidatus Bipolaricaulota bacterium]|nr:AEC family transporter [Candidatus Bipolaricaulota bacterium]